jgi:hypothetical protein
VFWKVSRWNPISRICFTAARAAFKRSAARTPIFGLSFAKGAKTKEKSAPTYGHHRHETTRRHSILNDNNEVATDLSKYFPVHFSVINMEELTAKQELDLISQADVIITPTGGGSSAKMKKKLMRLELGKVHHFAPC